MSTFRGRAPSGLINRETGNYAYLGENGEIAGTGGSCPCSATVADRAAVDALFN